jgi:bifunctional non-homologous end joining protein LigD
MHDGAGAIGAARTPGRRRHADRLADTPDMRVLRIPPGFIVPAQPVLASRPPVGIDWVHEIKHDGYRMIVRRDGPSVRLYAATRMIGPCGWRRSPLLPSRSRPRASPLTARRLCSGLTACRGLKSCAAGRLRTPRSSMLSTLSSMTARICAISHSSAARRRGTAVAQPRAWHSVQCTHEVGPVVFAHACRLGAEGIVERLKWT